MAMRARSATPRRTTSSTAARRRPAKPPADAARRQGVVRIVFASSNHAVGFYRRSLAADPEQPVAWVNLGLALEQTDDVSGATQAYERAVALYPDEALAHLNGSIDAAAMQRIVERHQRVVRGGWTKLM